MTPDNPAKSKAKTASKRRPKFEIPEEVVAATPASEWIYRDAVGTLTGPKENGHPPVLQAAPAPARTAPAKRAPRPDSSGDLIANGAEAFAFGFMAVTRTFLFAASVATLPLRLMRRYMAA